MGHGCLVPHSKRNTKCLSDFPIPHAYLSKMPSTAVVRSRVAFFQWYLESSRQCYQLVFVVCFVFVCMKIPGAINDSSWEKWTNLFWRYRRHALKRTKTLIGMKEEVQRTLVLFMSRVRIGVLSKLAGLSSDLRCLPLSLCRRLSVWPGRPDPIGCDQRIILSTSGNFFLSLPLPCATKRI